MNAYLNSLNEKEKWMVIGTVIALIFFIYFLFLYSPLNNKVSQKSAELSEKMVTLKWMQEVRYQNHSSQTKQKVDSSQLLSALSTQLKKNSNLTFPYQLQQTGSGDIQLSFEVVPFNLFISWWEEISKRYAIVIKQFDAERTKTAGLTRLRIIFDSV